MVGSKGSGSTTREYAYLWAMLYSDGCSFFTYETGWKRYLSVDEFERRRRQDYLRGVKTRIRVRAKSERWSDV